jgi:hypothetical protein
MPGTKGRSGGHRQGAGRKPTYRRVDLPNFTAELVAQLIKEAELMDTPDTANIVVSAILTEVLTNERAAWVATFRQNAALPALSDYAEGK